MSGITCCKGCVPPKRHTGCHQYCHQYCEEYIEQKIKLEKDKQAEREWKETHPEPFFKFTR